MGLPTQGPDGTWYAGPQSVPVDRRGRMRRGVAWLGRRVATVFRGAGNVGKRAITSLPWVSGGPRASVVSPERAVALVPLFACLRVLADNVSTLPVQMYRRQGAGRQPSSFIPDLLFRPAARDNLVEWLHKCILSLALRGNAYGLITKRDTFGFPTMVEWLSPDDVWVDETRPTLPVFYWMGHEVPAEDIVHIPWFVLPGRVVGLSPVAAFAHTIGVGLAATEYGRSWFDNGGTPPATMKNTTKTINRAESEEIRDRLMASIRSGKPLVYGTDWDFTALPVNPEESQFIETMRLNATQIAAIYGVPPELVGGEVGGSLTYSSPEQRQIELGQLTLRPWLVRIENRLSALLPGREFVKFNIDAMIRTDTLSRYKAHASALASNWRTINEVRAIEDLGPVPWGDAPFTPGAPEPESDPEEDPSE